MSVLEKLEKERAQIEAKIAAAKEEMQKSRKDALAMVVKLMKEYGLALKEVSAEVKLSAKATRARKAATVKKVAKSAAATKRAKATKATAKKVAGGRPVAKRLASKAVLVPKYRDPASGKTWSGRGLQPSWFRDGLSTGKSPEFFAYKPGVGKGKA